MKTMNLKFATLLIILFINTISFSQKKERPTEKMEPEKIAELRIKKMTLELDLTEKQQKEIKPFLVCMYLQTYMHHINELLQTIIINCIL